MKIALIGAAGQLGRDLAPRLSGQVIPLGRPDCDITDADRLDARLTEVRPDAIINCAAYNFVDKAESEPEAAFAVNAFGVRNLARIVAKLGAVLMHFSTDYVFGLDADRHLPYLPTDPPGPQSVYAASKLAGEFMIRAECEKHFIVRTCGLYGVWGSGGKGTNFVETMLCLAGHGNPLKVVNDQLCTPSYSADVAAVAVQLIDTDRYGLYHVTNAGQTTWHDFAAAIFELSGLTPILRPTTTREYAPPVRRPAYSVLNCDSLTAAGIAPPQPWRNALSDYLQERKSKKPAG